MSQSTDPTDSNLALRGAITAILDRRQVLRGIGATTAIGLTPLGAFAALAPAAEPTVDHRANDRHVDDIWGLYPRYSQNIGFGRRRNESIQAQQPVDTQFGV
jgi:hypothetical protein